MLQGGLFTRRSAAHFFNVSIATIRNWIKLGHLECTEEGYITESSIKAFYNERVGNSKLSSRANKQHKRCENNKRFNISQWQSYEESLPESHRNREGVYYTPERITSSMLSLLSSNELSDKSFMDPCCGSGNFIIKAIEMGIKPENIYGYDIDPNAVAITKRRIKELTGYTSQKIKCTDFLEIADKVDISVDYIFTNPPWGKKFAQSRRAKLAARYNTGGSADSSALFFMASVLLLKEGGTISFLVQDAFCNIGTFAETRRYMLNYKIDSIVSYGKAFRTILAKAQAITLTKELDNNSSILCVSRYGEFYRSAHSFLTNPKYIFNYTITPEQNRVIESLFRRNYITLAGKARWGLGIVTGDNARHCSKKQQEGYIAVYRGTDITPEELKEPSAFIDPDLSKYQQIAPRDMYDAPEKLLYKFISSKLCFYCDRGQHYPLNSANMLILEPNFPLSHQTLADLLNSDFMSWLFYALFSTHKVLRNNLELLPIFIDYFDGREFSEADYLAYLGIELSESGGYIMR